MLQVATTTTPPATAWQTRAARLGRLLLAAAAGALAVRFIVENVFRYFHWDAGHYGRYWPMRGFLLLHVVGALLALVCGPLQLWTGWLGRTGAAHRIRGRLYVLGVLTGSIGALSISLRWPVFPTLGLALDAMAAAWIISTGLAYAAIRRGHVELHRELMLRSYVVTFSFVSFRTIQHLPVLTQLAVPERFTAIGWLAWTVPLLATELVLQGRKVMARRPA